MFWRKNICKENMLGSIQKNGMDETLLQQSWFQSVPVPDPDPDPVPVPVPQHWYRYQPSFDK
jgi:hypothetical protein